LTAEPVSLADRFCDTVDRINSRVGRFFALSILVVVIAVLYEVFARGMFGQATLWANETTIYLSAVAYVIGGGYALAHRRHVRIDVIYDRLSPRTRAKLDLFTFVFFFIYVAGLIWVGSTLAWGSFLEGEGTGTPWNPRIWPVKFAIPVAGVLLLLQGIANLLRDLGIAEPRVVSIELISFLFVAVFVVILLTGLPLAFATGAVAVFFAVVLFGWPGLTLIVGRVFTLMGNYVLVSVPLFIFMACVLERAGIAEAIFRAAHVWSGRMPGGLAVAVIISCALMAAMVGVIGAEIVTMGVVALPAMLARGYKKELALGCICAGGGLATLIPPSVVFIMYGLTAGVSIGQLYMAGVIPGLMLAAMYIAYIIVRCQQRPDFAPPASAAELAIPLRAKVALLKELILPGLVAFSVLGSLYLGWATPTEAAGVGVLGAVVAMWWNGKFGWDKLRSAAEDTAKVTVMLYWLFFGSSALIGVYTLAGGTKLIQDALAGLPVGPLGVVILIQIVWIILGCFIDWIGILLLTAPIFVPVVLALGFDPVWMGVLFCMNMQISYISPPFGPAAFYLKGVTPAGITLGDIFGSIWPYMGLQVTALGLVVAFPQIALWLPNTMMK